MSHRKHVTLALIRQLAAMGAIAPRKRVGRWPAPVHPDAIGIAYHAAVVREVNRPMREEFDRIQGEVLALLVEQRRREGRTDSAIGPGRAAQIGEAKAEKEAAALERQLRGATDNGKRAGELIDRAARTFAHKFHPGPLHDVVHEFAKVTDRHSRLQLDRQLRQAIGVPLSAIEKPMQDRLGEWTAGNVSLIKTVPERFFDRLQLDVQEAFAGGTHPATLAEKFAEDYDISDRDAMRITTDQTLSLAADLNHSRMESLGIERGTWATMQDGRVCEICESRQGQSFALDEGIDGELPGDCHPCDRCYTIPDLDGLLGALPE